ncbi:hypothetical protein [Planctomycetes bacterium TBK1r]|uniref:YHS domain protein n=1 Tax=Stieleria magnilauensis TaxID=2527963 RepID=A0ABX5Y2H4_9BACT|nr:hypothetical protein TBK1r_61790 [Planctomycetes bacterium TBK1r]
MKRFLASAAAVLLVATATTLTADVDLKDIQCVVAKKAADASKSADYKDAKVYFCCNGCAGKFAKDTEKYAVKANHQLVATKQYVQKSCPFSGGKLNESTAIKLAGTEVAFCCNNCKGKAEGAEDDEAKLKLIYNDKAFKKGFELAKKE